MEKNKLSILELLDSSLLHDINNSLEYVADWGNRLDERWLQGTASPYFKDHYRNHVLQRDEGEKWIEYPQKSEDGEYRIKMPPMSEQEYEANAEKLAAETNVGSFKDKNRTFIGGITERTVGGIKKQSLVKIKRSSEYKISPQDSLDGKLHILNRMCEIVVYIKAPDGSNYIITYMLARSIEAALVNFTWVGDLPSSETTKPLNTTYYLCVNNYETTAGETFFEIAKFDNYREASEYFSKNKNTSEIIKVENGVRKTMSKKNTKNVVPEIRSKDGELVSVGEALKILNKNNFNK